MNTQVRQEAPHDPAALERQNEEIRADMGRTLEALERKLSPGQLLDRGLALIKEHGGELATNLGESVKQNPMPALLTAVGIAWMMAFPGRGPAMRGEGRPEGSGLKQRAAETRERVGETAGHIRERASATRERLADARTSVGESMHSAADRGRHARARFQSALEEQPLAVGAIAVALGAILGSALPPTRREDRMLGETRDKALDQARAAGERQLERGQQTASRAAEGAKQAVSEEQRPH